MRIMEDPKHMSTAKTCLSAIFVVFTSTFALANSSSDYVVLNFTAQWCQPCKEMSKPIEQLSEQGWLIRQIDVDREKSLVQRWKVTSLPTLIILLDGREIDRIAGKLTLAELMQRLPKTSGTIAASPTGALSNVQPISMASSAFKPSSVDPMLTTVRIKIEDGMSTSFGSGTIIDQHGDEALVLTCGHLFRNVNSQAAMTVEAPIDGRLVSIPATIVDFRCDETDIGLIAFRPGRPMAVAPLLPRGVELREQDRVSSFGCDQGADPTRRDSHISKLNRYIGPSNVEVAKAPEQGRSGGGLFNDKGQLIGVCYAADAELDEGLFSGPEVVYQQLARLDLSRLYHSAPNVAQVASNSTRPATPMSISIPDRVTPIPIKDSFPDRSMGDGWKAAIGQAAQAARESAANSIASVVRNNNGPTLTAILRDANGKEQQIVIPSPSPALLQALQSHASSEPQMAIR